MGFTVEFYESAAGRSPVLEFLDGLKASDPGGHAAVMRGLAKLRNRQYHREPLSKALGDGLFELRRVAEVLGVTVRVTLAPKGESGPMSLSEAQTPYRAGRKS